MNHIVEYIKSFFLFRSRNGTVRFMFPALISFAAILGAAAITSEDVSYVRLETSDATIEAGKPFSVDVFAYAHVPVNAVDITLQFDSSSVEVTGVDTGQSVITIWTQEPAIEDEKVILRGGTFRNGFLQEHKIATINLKGRKIGQSLLQATDIMLLAGDGAGSPVAVAEVSGSEVSLYIYDENTSPENIAIAVSVNLITDIDGDGKVTLRDISAFMGSWHSKNKLYDFNGDGRMTFRDFSIILASYFF
jgi:hypothetical protein